MAFLFALFALLTFSCQGGEKVLTGMPSGPYRAELKLEPDPPVAGKKTLLTYTIRHDRTGEPVSDLQALHERILHTFIFNRTLSYFAHTHHEDFFPLLPRDITRATFRYPHTFPHGGEYLIFVEFTRKDRTWLKKFQVCVRGKGEQNIPAEDLGRTKTVGSYRISLRSSPDPPVAGYETELVCRVENLEGKPVKRLGTYLGSEVHLALLRLDGKHFGHQHAFTPEMAAMRKKMREEDADPQEVARMMVRMMREAGRQVYFGPEIPLRHVFPEAGVYKLFFEIAPEGEVIRADFMIEVVGYEEGVDTELHSVVPGA